MTSIVRPKKQKSNVRPHAHLVLVRHGESVWNVLGKWTGWEDVPLSDKGKEEAKKAAHTIRDIPFHLAFSSDLMRAMQTLDIIKQELQPPDITSKKDSAFRERHYGIYTGKNKWDIRKEFGEEKFLAIRRGWDVPLPTGETLKDVYRRVVPKFQSDIQPHLKNGKNVLFVAHGNSNRALIKHIENISDEDISDVEMATGEVLIYTFDAQMTVLNKAKRATSSL